MKPQVERLVTVVFNHFFYHIGWYINLFYMQVLFNWICTNFLVRNQSRTKLETFQICIRMFTQTFSLQAIWIFALCNEVIASHYRLLTNRLNQDMKVLKRDELFYIMKCLKCFEKCHDALNKGFSFTLMTASCLSFIQVLTSSHNAIEDLLVDKKIIWGFFFWDLFDATDYFFRFVLVCYAADRAPSAGNMLLII